MIKLFSACRPVVRLGARDLEVDNIFECIDDVCADPPIDILIKTQYTRHNLNNYVAENIGLLKLQIAVEYSSKSTFYLCVWREKQKSLY